MPQASLLLSHNRVVAGRAACVASMSVSIKPFFLLHGWHVLSRALPCSCVVFPPLAHLPQCWVSA